MEKGKAYISFTPVGVGKRKKIEIEFWDLTEGDTQIMKLGYGTFWFAKHNNALCNYIGEREFDKILFGKRGENSEQNKRIFRRSN